jgi:hypothetical protein
MGHRDLGAFRSRKIKQTRINLTGEAMWASTLFAKFLGRVAKSYRNVTFTVSEKQEAATRTTSWLSSGKGDTELLALNDRLCREGYAGVFDIQALDQDNRWFIEGADDLLRGALERAMTTHQVTEPIRLIWLSGDRLNALAIGKAALGKTQDTTNVIAVNFGTLLVLMSVFTRLLASPRVYPEVGNIELEILQPPFLLERNETGLFVKEHSTPRCPVRRVFASMLSSQALLFLLFHEFSHLVNGHLSAVDIRKEVQLRRSNSRNIIDHTLEMDADAGAVTSSFNELIHGFFAETATIREDSDNAYELSEIRRALGVGIFPTVGLLSTVMCTFFMLFSGGPLTRDTMFAGTHPHPTLRMFMALPVISAHLERAGIPGANSDLPQLAAAPRIGMVTDELILPEEAKTVVRSVLSFLDAGYDKEYIRALMNCWRDELYPRLNEQKLTKRKLAPPQDF